MRPCIYGHLYFHLRVRAYSFILHTFLGVSDSPEPAWSDIGQDAQGSEELGADQYYLQEYPGEVDPTAEDLVYFQDVAEYQ